MIFASSSFGALPRQALVRLGLLASSLLIFVLVAELLLRFFPACLPAGAYYGSGAYDPELGIYLPDAPVIYNKTRYHTRVPNKEGFMDVDHDPEKPRGVLRLGFFGDSYVESVQVPLDDTFLRRLPRVLAGRPVEPLAFGISGLGTLHSLLLHRKYSPRYGLDIVVYVFVENDPGDHSYEIQKARKGVTTPRPTATLASTPEGFEIRWPPRPQDKPLYLRAAMFAKNRTLFARVVYSRLQLLWRRDRAEDPPGLNRPSSPTMPTQEDLPGVWPEELLAEAQALSYRILARFQHEVELQGRRFLVLYVPRGTAALDGSLDIRDTWFPWLEESCRALGIDLVDPRDDLRRRLESGDAVYADHWTPAGHEVISTVLTRELARIARESGASSTTRGPDRAGSPGA